MDEQNLLVKNIAGITYSNKTKGIIPMEIFTLIIFQYLWVKYLNFGNWREIKETNQSGNTQAANTNHTEKHSNTRSDATLKLRMRSFFFPNFRRMVGGGGFDKIFT